MDDNDIKSELFITGIIKYIIDDDYSNYKYYIFLESIINKKNNYTYYTKPSIDFHRNNGGNLENINVSILQYLTISYNVIKRDYLIINILDKYKQINFLKHINLIKNKKIDRSVQLFFTYKLIIFLYKTNIIKSINDIEEIVIIKFLHYKKWFNLFLKLGLTIKDVQEKYIKDLVDNCTRIVKYYSYVDDIEDIHIRFDEFGRNYTFQITKFYKNLIYYINKYNLVIPTEIKKDNLYNLIPLNRFDLYYPQIKEFIKNGIITFDIFEDFSFTCDISYQLIFQNNSYKTYHKFTKFIPYKYVSKLMFKNIIYVGEFDNYEYISYVIFLNFLDNGLTIEHFKFNIDNHMKYLIKSGRNKQILLHLKNLGLTLENIEFFRDIYGQLYRENYNSLIDYYT